MVARDTAGAKNCKAETESQRGDSAWRAARRIDRLSTTRSRSISPSARPASADSKSHARRYVGPFGSVHRGDDEIIEIGNALFDQACQLSGGWRSTKRPEGLKQSRERDATDGEARQRERQSVGAEQPDRRKTSQQEDGGRGRPERPGAQH